MLLDEPDLANGLEIYQEGFWKLNTTRQCGMSIGPISDNAIEDRMDRWGIEGWENRYVFEKLIGAQDFVYLEYKREEAAPKKKPINSSTGGVKGWVKKKLGRT